MQMADKKSYHSGLFIKLNSGCLVSHSNSQHTALFPLAPFPPLTNNAWTPDPHTAHRPFAVRRTPFPGTVTCRGSAACHLLTLPFPVFAPLVSHPSSLSPSSPLNLNLSTPCAASPCRPCLSSPLCLGGNSINTWLSWRGIQSHSLPADHVPHGGSLSIPKWRRRGEPPLVPPNNTSPTATVLFRQRQSRAGVDTSRGRCAGAKSSAG
ncbi:hypothetical protein E2C01_070089 [Portunus trituberculatus]|uniref:Uncharacterized protein n=1 Tax=Portunus trituberculatus TaxID=210409 RepID=A0A5B7I171_PORTR|nr:hypothetical protein [Portunus trituberculatus]